MAGWTTHRGTAVVLPIDNIDTDQLIPARFMSVPRSAGYGDYLLHDMRRDAEGALRTDFPLNDADATLLIAGRNFGSGSSREAAVYALVDAGIRVVIAPSFGDIFASNAVNNGLLPARVSEDDIAAIIAAQADHIDVSIQARALTVQAQTFEFALDDTQAQKLQNGWDDIDLTLQHADTIAHYKQARRAAHPWSWPCP